MFGMKDYISRQGKCVLWCQDFPQENCIGKYLMNKNRMFHDIPQHRVKQ